jgi:uncharacterized protein (DUF427 family)
MDLKGPPKGCEFPPLLYQKSCPVAPPFLAASHITNGINMKATWNGKVIAESEQTIIIE